MAGIDTVYDKVVHPLSQLAETLERAERFKKGDPSIKSANLLVAQAIAKVEALISVAPTQEVQRPGL